MAQNDEETIASEVLSASLGGAISAGILYPLEVLKTKMQAAERNSDKNDDDEDDNSMLTAARKIYNQEGWSVFFRGVETSSFQSAMEKALYFFAYTGLKGIHAAAFLRPKSPGSNDGGAPPPPPPSLDAATNLFLGCLAEWAHLPISLPIDAWTTQIQTSKEAPMVILCNMLSGKSGGPKTWYKGLSAYYVLCFKPALQYTVYEQVKKLWVQHRRNKSLSAAEAFALGAVARIVATVLVFPFLRAKVLMQTKKANNNNNNANTEEGGSGSVQATTTNTTTTTSVTTLLWETLQREGFSGLYQGLGPELTRGIFSAALMLMIKERLVGTVRRMLAPPASPSQQQQRQRSAS